MDGQSLVIIALLDGVDDMEEIEMNFVLNQHTSLKGSSRHIVELQNYPKLTFNYC